MKKVRPMKKVRERCRHMRDIQALIAGSPTIARVEVVNAQGDRLLTVAVNMATVVAIACTSCLMEWEKP